MKIYTKWLKVVESDRLRHALVKTDIEDKVWYYRYCHKQISTLIVYDNIYNTRPYHAYVSVSKNISIQRTIKL